MTLEEERRGTLEPGRLADLAVLDGDPLAPGTDVAAVRVTSTYLAGQRVSGAELASP